MTQERRNELMFYLSILTAVFIALFWFVWYLAKGEVPSVSKFKVHDNGVDIAEYNNLPFSISRWWDVLVGPIYSVLVVSIVYLVQKQKNKHLYESVVTVLAIGLASGLFFGFLGFIAGGFVDGITLGLVAGLVIPLVSADALGLVPNTLDFLLNPVLGLTFGLAVAIVIGFTFGLVVGLVAGLAVGAIFGLLFGLVHLIKRTKSMFVSLNNWFVAR